MEYISVTGLLSAQGLYDDRFFTEHSANKGSVIHKAIEYELRGTLAISSLHPDIVKYVESFQAWRKSVSLVILAVEKEFKDDVLGIVGHPDLVCKVNGIPWVIDFKAAVPQEVYKIQTAAYKHLCRTNGIVVLRRGCLYVKANAAMADLKEHPNPADEAYFQHLVGAYNCRKLYGPKTKEVE